MRTFIDRLSVKCKKVFTGFYTFKLINVPYDFSDADSSQYEVIENNTGDKSLIINMEYYPQYDKYGTSKSHSDAVLLEKGRYFTNEEYMNGDMKIVMPYSTDPNHIGKTIDFFGRKYEAIGIASHNSLWDYEVSLYSLDDDFEISELYVVMDKSITPEAYEEIGELLNDITGGRAKMTPELDVQFADLDYYNTLILITLTLAVTAFINLAILYMYILLSRRKRLAVFMIRWCSKAKVRLMCNAEIISVSAIIFGVCALAYHYAACRF